MTALSFLLVSEECRAWKRTFLTSFENHLRARLNVTPSASLTYFEVLTVGLEIPPDFKHFILSQVNLCCWSCFYCAICTFSMLFPTSAFILMTVCSLELKLKIKCQNSAVLKGWETEIIFKRRNKRMCSLEIRTIFKVGLEKSLYFFIISQNKQDDIWLAQQNRNTMHFWSKMKICTNLKVIRGGTLKEEELKGKKTVNLITVDLQCSFSLYCLPCKSPWVHIC